MDVDAIRIAGMVIIPLAASAALLGYIAKQKGREPLPWMVIGMFFFPLSLLVLLLVGETVQRKPCEKCGEPIPIAALVCRFCDNPTERGRLTDKINQAKSQIPAIEDPAKGMKIYKSMD